MWTGYARHGGRVCTACDPSRVQGALFHKYGPKSELSPTTGEPCPICQRPLAVGDYTTLVRGERTSRHGNDNLEVHYECALERA